MAVKRAGNRRKAKRKKSQPVDVYDPNVVLAPGYHKRRTPKPILRVKAGQTIDEALMEADRAEMEKYGGITDPMLGRPRPATEAARNMRTLGGPSDTHYASLKGAQPVEIMEDWALPPHLHSVLKYIARYRSKGGMQDLLKAQWWLDRYITHVEETGKF